MRELGRKHPVEEPQCIKVTMNLFDWLVVGHLAGDFLLQSDNMARHKGQQWAWMFWHVSVYMLVLGVVLVGYALSTPVPFVSLFLVWLFLLVSHIVLDRRGFTRCWMRLVGMSPNHSWLPIVVDQVFHILTLAIVAQILAPIAS
jgi:hypothetical protein